MPRKAIIAGDIGGTKIDFAVYPVVEGRISEKALTEGGVPTEKGEAGMVSAMREVYRKASEKTQGYDIIAVAMGSPGRPITERARADEPYIVAPGSVSNLADEGKLDGRDLQKIYQLGLPEATPLFIENDAVVQMKAMLNDLLKGEGRSVLYGKKVGYIGIGTGLGGGFAEVDKKGAVQIRTDGHIYDIRLQMPEDMKRLVAINAKLPRDKKFIFSEEGMSLRAEDVLSGSALRKITGHTGEEIADNPELFSQSREAFAIIGRGLAELVEKIHKGEFDKIKPHDNWPSEHKEIVKGTKIFLLGGGVAANQAITKAIVDVAQDKLREKDITDVEFIACPGKNTTLAAASIVPQNVLNQTQSRRR